MCEVLLRVVDKTNADPYLDAVCLKRGDVVVVCDDGWAWSQAEMQNPDWRIVKLPGVTTATMMAFLGPEFDSDPSKPSRVLRSRAFALDLGSASLPAAFKKFLADDSRKAATASLALTDNQIAALKSGKARLRDPNVVNG